MKESFILYTGFYESIKDLSDTKKGQLLDAIFKDRLGEKVVFNSQQSDIRMAFSFIKNQFRLNDEKYEKICEKNRLNAKKRWNQNDATASDRMRKDAKHADKDNDNENENDTDNEKKIIYTKKYFKNHSKEILEEARNKYPDKNVDIVMEEFLDGIEIKDYKYKNYKLAYFKWIRNSKHTFNQSNILGNKRTIAIN
jgi:hypothetical protein